MRNGMLWHDNDKKTSFQEKVERAAVYFKGKYNFTPDTCAINPLISEEQKGIALVETSVGKIEIIVEKVIAPSYFLVGTKEDRELKNKCATS